MFKKRIDMDTVAAYENKIPRSACFKSFHDGGWWVVQIVSIDGKKLDNKTLLITQAKKRSDILPMVNDLLMTYYDIPDELRGFYESRITLEGSVKGERVLAGA